MKKCLEYDKDNPSRLATDYVHIGNYFSHLGDTEPKYLYIALKYYNLAKKIQGKNILDKPHHRSPQSKENGYHNDESNIKEDDLNRKF